MEYNSQADTLLHIKRVNEFLLSFSAALLERATKHDSSKLKDPEKFYFDKYTPLLKTLQYGTPEYKESLEALKPALEHHYKNNSHHPEHYPNGVDGMNLLDVVEMFFDWWAATERNKDGDIMKSIDINKERFKISDQLANIFKNTVNAFIS